MENPQLNTQHSTLKTLKSNAFDLVIPCLCRGTVRCKARSSEAGDSRPGDAPERVAPSGKVSEGFWAERDRAVS